MKTLDRFLNSITMYRLVLYGLAVSAFASVVYGLFGILPWSALQLLASLATLLIVCLLVNYLFSALFRAPTNTESAAITAFILYFVFVPITQIGDFYTLIIAGALAMASKYILAIHKKHIFNPVAISAVILGLFGNGSAFWWVATPSLLPFILIIGLMIVKKIRRFQLFASFLAVSLILNLYFAVSHGQAFIQALTQAFTSWPIIFFATVMLTEPLTTPPTRQLQIIYGALVGALFSIQFHFGPVYSSPELALCIGNIFSYLIMPRRRYKIFLREKIRLTPDTYEFVFTPDQKVVFKPGQYLEWTLPHSKSDNRGNRRYFTIASSPTEPEIKLGVRISPDKSSSFKSFLLEMKTGDLLSVSDLSGDFTLPEDPEQKLVLIAGGIGITPFRSMIQYLVDKNSQQDIVLFYNSNNIDGFAYREIFDRAAQKINLKTNYVVTSLPPDSTWTGKSGYLTPQMILDEVPDYKERIFYLSGPNAMVENYKKMLNSLGISGRQIVTDYFPGF